MQLVINGEVRELPGSLSLREVLQYLGLQPERVAIERNRVIVKREHWDEERVEAGDEIEIVQFVGGG